MKSFCLIFIFSFFINHIANANEDIKVIGYTEGGNQWLLTLSNKYISTNDPKIFTKEINIYLKALLCKGCNYTHHNIVCQKNRRLMDGEEVNCKDTDANFADNIQSVAKINCYGKLCKLKVTNLTTHGADAVSHTAKGRNILFEMGDAEFNLDDRIIVNKVDEKNENDVTNSKNNISEKQSNDNKSKLEKAKISCLKLGLEVKTEKFAECVLMFF